MQTQTTVTTKTSTLSGPCATVELIAPERFIPASDQTVISNEVPLSNAYACCKTCRSYRPGLCLAYFNILGETCNLLTVDKKPENPPFCPNIDNSASFFVFIDRYPNRLGGRGVCGINFFLFPWSSAQRGSRSLAEAAPKKKSEVGQNSVHIFLFLLKNPSSLCNIWNLYSTGWYFC